MEKQEVGLLALAPPVATLIGALVGATAAIAAAAFTSWRLLALERIRIAETRELERSRLSEAREDVISQELIEAVRQLTVKMSESLHSMCWLTWLARASGDRVTQKWLDSYDSEQHKILPEIQGHLTTVATLDADMYEKLEPLVYKLYGLDVYIGEASLLIDKDRDEMINRLTYGYQAMNEFHYLLPKQVADLTSRRTRMPTVPGSVSELTDHTSEPKSTR